MMSSPDTPGSGNYSRNIDKLIHEPARYLIMAYLSVVESADAIFLQRQTELTWGNLSSHLSKLEAAEYIEIKKDFLDKKPHTMIAISDRGRNAFENYRDTMKQVLDTLPDV